MAYFTTDYEHNRKTTFYIFEPNHSIQPIVVKPKINIFGYSFETAYKLISDRIYFFNYKDKMVEWLDFDGNVHKLDFTKVKDSTYFDYVLTKDGTKIAWIDSNGLNQKSEGDYTIFVASIDGSNKKQLYTLET